MLFYLRSFILALLYFTPYKELIMTTLILELNNDLIRNIEELKNTFEDYDFKTKDNFSTADLDDISGFEKLAVQQGQVIPFDDFKRKIRSSLFSLDDDVSKSDFDWDLVEQEYDQVQKLYENYSAVIVQVEENLTGQQEVSTTLLESEESIKNLLLQYFIEQNLVYEIENQGEIFYMINDQIRAKL